MPIRLVAKDGVERCHRVEMPVEAEYVLVEVRLEVLLAHAMVRAAKRCFKVREHEMDTREVLVGVFGITVHDNRLAPVADVHEVVVALPTIRTDLAAACDALGHELL